MLPRRATTASWAATRRCSRHSSPTSPVSTPASGRSTWVWTGRGQQSWSRRLESCGGGRCGSRASPRPASGIRVSTFSGRLGGGLRGFHSRENAQLVVHFMADPVAGLWEMARVTRRLAHSLRLGLQRGATDRWAPSGRRRGRSTPTTSAAGSQLAGAQEGTWPPVRRGRPAREKRGGAVGKRQEHAGFDDWWASLQAGRRSGRELPAAGLDEQHSIELRELNRSKFPAGAFRGDRPRVGGTRQQGTNVSVRRSNNVEVVRARHGCDHAVRRGFRRRERSTGGARLPAVFEDRPRPCSSSGTRSSTCSKITEADELIAPAKVAGASPGAARWYSPLR